MRIPDLYHYQKFDEGRLRQLLIGKKLYMSSPADINDPWDCQPHFDTRQVVEPAYRANLADYFAGLSKRMQAGNKTPEQVAAEIEAIRTDQEAALQILMIQSEGMRASIARQWRLYCLTAHPDSELMWAHYGDSHRGIALQYDGDGPLAKQASQVSYFEHYPMFDFLGEPHTVLLAKAKAWAYESEYRVFAWEKRHASADAEVMIADENFAKLDSGSLTGIVLGALASPATEKKVKALVVESGEELVVHRAVKLADRYGLTFKRIC